MLSDRIKAAHSAARERGGRRVRATRRPVQRRADAQGRRRRGRRHRPPARAQRHPPHAGDQGAAAHRPARHAHRVERRAQHRSRVAARRADDAGGHVHRRRPRVVHRVRRLARRPASSRRTDAVPATPGIGVGRPPHPAADRAGGRSRRSSSTDPCTSATPAPAGAGAAARRRAVRVRSRSRALRAPSVVGPAGSTASTSSSRRGELVVITGAVGSRQDDAGARRCSACCRATAAPSGGTGSSSTIPGRSSCHRGRRTPRRCRGCGARRCARTCCSAGTHRRRHGAVAAAGATRRRRRRDDRRTRRRSSGREACACRAASCNAPLAARALVRRPELLVVDDLSSALDVETEQALWEGLADDRRRVRHRPRCSWCRTGPAVLERADRVITLDDGRVAGPPRRSAEIPA